MKLLVVKQKVKKNTRTCYLLSVVVCVNVTRIDSDIPALTILNSSHGLKSG